MYLQHALRAHDISSSDLTGHPPCAGRPDRNRQCLERTLGAVVVVVAVRAANMQSHIRSLRKALQAVRNHLGAQVANLLTTEAQVDNRPRSAREIDHGPGESLVEGSVAATETGERLPGAEGLCECGAEGEEGIFCGVVVVDWRMVRGLFPGREK